MLIVRKARRNLSYKNRRYDLTSLEKMNIKSIGEITRIVTSVRVAHIVIKRRNSNLKQGKSFLLTGVTGDVVRIMVWIEIGLVYIVDVAFLS